MSAVTFATAQLLRALPRARIGRAVGRLAERPWSPALGKAIVGLYSKAYDVALDECADRGPWASFDAFFTRRLRAGARPVAADPRSVLSPADGCIHAVASVRPGGTLVVKGQPYRVDELVGDSREARRFEGGAGLVVYLSPRDYHRVHSPVTGSIRRIRSLPGDFYPVNSVGAKHIPSLYCRNRRVAIEIDSDRLGRVSVVMVAAMIVGRITTIGSSARDVPLGDHTFDPPLRVEQGDEIGVFHLGSSVVLLVESRAVGEWVTAEGPVRYGQALIRAARDGARHDNGRPAQSDGARE